MGLGPADGRDLLLPVDLYLIHETVDHGPQRLRRGRVGAVDHVGRARIARLHDLGALCLIS